MTCMKILIACEFSGIVRDAFIFAAFTGLAFIDVQQLAPEHIVEDSNGNLWIRKPRQKTKNMCNIPLLDIPLEILRKYAKHPACQKKNRKSKRILVRKSKTIFHEFEIIRHKQMKNNWFLFNF